MQDKIELQPFEAEVLKIKTRGETRTITFALPCTAGPGQYFEVGGGIDNSGTVLKPLFLASASAIGEPHTKFNYKTANPKANPTIDKLNGLKSGDKVQLKGPCGNPLIVNGEKVLLIAGGTALTVLRNMEKNFSTIGKQVELIYSAKKRPDPLDPLHSDVAFPKKVREYEQKDYNYITYTQENVHLAEEHCHYGHVDEYLRKKELSKGTTIFVCGPPEFENSIVAQLLDEPHYYDPNFIYVSSWGKIAPITSSELLQKRFHLETYVNKFPSETKKAAAEMPVNIYQSSLFSTPADSNLTRKLKTMAEDRDDDSKPKRNAL